MLHSVHEGWWLGRCCFLRDLWHISSIVVHAAALRSSMMLDPTVAGGDDGRIHTATCPPLLPTNLVLELGDGGFLQGHGTNGLQRSVHLDICQFSEMPLRPRAVNIALPARHD